MEIIVSIESIQRRFLGPLIASLLVAWGAACLSPSDQATESASAADVIFHGTVLTLVEDESMASALAIRGEEIVAVGTREEIDALKGRDTRVVELDQAALLPGFIDAHGHVTMLGTFTGLTNVASPPVGPVEDLAGLQDALRAHASASEGWIVGRGYDESLLREGRHPNRDDLDAVSRERPIFLVHVSGHLGVANSKALELAGINAQSPDPKAGVIRRRPGLREPDGVLEEHCPRTRRRRSSRPGA